MNLSSRSVIRCNAIITLSNPRLVDVEPCWIVDLHSLSILRLNIDWMETRCTLILNLTKTHTTTNNRFVPSMLQMLLNIPRGLLLRETHLHNRLLNSLSRNLVREREKLLYARHKIMRFALQLSLRLLQHLGLSKSSTVLNIANNHLALPTQTRHWVWVERRRHGVWVAGLGGDAAGLGLGAGDGFVFEDGGGGEVAANEDGALWFLGQGLVEEGRLWG